MKHNAIPRLAGLASCGFAGCALALAVAQAHASASAIHARNLRCSNEAVIACMRPSQASGHYSGCFQSAYAACQRMSS